MRGHILFISGDDELRAAARKALEKAGFHVAETLDLAGAWTQIDSASRPDLVLLPWAMHDATRGTLARLRDHDETRHSRLIVFAERDSLREAITALEFGADDCISIPLDDAELVARVNACLRRPAASIRPDELRAGPMVLDKAAHSLSIDATPVELAPAEFRLMTFFLENPGRVFSRAELLRRAWSRNIKAGPRTVDVHVRRLRQILEQFDCDDMIQTVRGFGYRFSQTDTSASRPADAGAGAGRSNAEPRRAHS